MVYSEDRMSRFNIQSFQKTSQVLWKWQKGSSNDFNFLATHQLLLCCCTFVLLHFCVVGGIFVLMLSNKINFWATHQLLLCCCIVVLLKGCCVVEGLLKGFWFCCCLAKFSNYFNFWAVVVLSCCCCGGRDCSCVIEVFLRVCREWDEGVWSCKHAFHVSLWFNSQHINIIQKRKEKDATTKHETIFHSLV